VRLTRYHLYVLVGLVMVFVGPLAFTQPGGGGRGGRGGGGRGGFMDPNQFFNTLSGGKDVLVVEEAKFPEQMAAFAPRIKQAMQEYMQRKGITNGQLTREQYLDYAEEFRQRMFRGGGRRGGGASGGSPPSSGSSGSGASSGGDDLEAKAREKFKEQDKNGDGVLTADEVTSGRLRREFDRWDTNKDGKLQFEEYKAYYSDRAQSGDKAGDKGGQPAEERRPVVYRVGKLPKELPAWFNQLDRDRDAQVGLYEWKQGGRDVEEFLKMDLNGDGLLTVEEVLLYQKAQAKLNNPAGEGGPGTGSPGSPGEGRGGGGRLRRPGPPGGGGGSGGGGFPNFGRRGR
jgi:hypothetical protein